MSGWTEERKKRQRELIHQWKPWLKSTGAKTTEGKKKSSQNAYKTGDSKKVRELIKHLNSLMRKQTKLVD